MARRLKAGHYVRSADGGFYQVRYSPGESVGLSDNRDLEPDEDVGLYLADPATGKTRGESVSLPAGELRRVADPYRKLPPIEALPEERPTCQYCGRRLDPECHVERAGLDQGHIPRRRAFKYWKGYPQYADTTPLFHSLTCALKFAVASHKAGMRIVKKETQ